MGAAVAGMTGTLKGWADEVELSVGECPGL